MLLEFGYSLGFLPSCYGNFVSERPKLIVRPETDRKDGVFLHWDREAAHFLGEFPEVFMDFLDYTFCIIAGKEVV